MGETITLQRLLEMQKKVWNFKINAEPELTDMVAREQLKSIGQLSRIGSLSSLPLTLHLMVKLIIYAYTVFIGIGSFYRAIWFLDVYSNLRHWASIGAVLINHNRWIK